MLADVLSRDGAELSATQTRRRNLANADHLAVLNAIWSAETQDARHDRYRELVTAALPPSHRAELSHQARWLFRTLRAAELAGLDPAEVTRTAIGSRDLAGVRDIAAVLDARIGPRVYPLLPEPPGPWTSRVPQLPDPARQAYLTGIAAQMDDRTRRLGQHTAQTAPAWATNALGPVPPGPAARRTWEHKAASIAAYREMYSYGHPRDPIGPEPSRETPDRRAAWHEAFLALGPVDQPDVRAMPDGRLWLLRDAYTVETAWAPPYGRKRTTAIPDRRRRRRPRGDPRRRRSRGRSQGRRSTSCRSPGDPGRQLPGAARPLPAPRARLRPDDGRPAAMGARHRRFPPFGHRCRRRTTPPPPRPEN